MNLADVMDHLGEVLDGIDGLRAFPYYADRVTPPAAVVGWPDTYEFDSTMVRGLDRIVFPVTVVVGRADARSARDDLAKYCDGEGDYSVKETLEFSNLSCRVLSVEFGTVTISSVEYLAATFDVEVMGWLVEPDES